VANLLPVLLMPVSICPGIVDTGIINTSGTGSKICHWCLKLVANLRLM
jgi:hypothetical protein